MTSVSVCSVHDLLPSIALMLLVTVDCNPSIQSDVISPNETAANDAAVKLTCNRGYVLRGSSIVCEGNASWSIEHSFCKEG